MLDVRLRNETCSNGSALRVWCGSQSSVCVVTDQILFPSTMSPGANGTKLGNVYNLLLGLSLALLSAVLIGVSVVMKKKALLRLQSDGGTRAGDGGHGYLKDWLWWGGLLTMGLGEACNFAAYAFAPATLVTPLGALAVIISAVLASYLFGEVLNFIGKFGCFLCILGSVLLVLHAPQEQEVTSLQEMSEMLLETGFLVYAFLVFMVTVVLVLIVAPRFGQTNILVYLSICSLLGAFTVSSAKGLAIALQTGIYDYMVFANPLTWLLLLTLVLSILAQVNYLNKSLDVFNTQIVYPIYYVLFTSVVLCTSAILFQEWSSMSPINIVSTIGSFMVIVVGVILLNLFRENELTLKKLSDRLSRPGEEAPTNVAARSPVAAATRSFGRKEDKCGLIENMVIESLPPMRDEGPRVFIIS
ncbi:magnesium transporter NIPA4 [Eucyclogobius newberryi]|uniref:magnesium transporter NIPA4 n=1 Tax=Eucyclogobius newberryi TaxID=166745 RepID=UPI003B5C981B